MGPRPTEADGGVTEAYGTVFRFIAVNHHSKRTEAGRGSSILIGQVKEDGSGEPFYPSNEGRRTTTWPCAMLRKRRILSGPRTPVGRLAAWPMGGRRIGAEDASECHEMTRSYWPGEQVSRHEAERHPESMKMAGLGLRVCIGQPRYFQRSQ